MALMQCPVCCATVSDKATNCPHCGNAIVKPQYRVRYRDYIKVRFQMSYVPNLI